MELCGGILLISESYTMFTALVNFYLYLNLANLKIVLSKLLHEKKK